MALRAVAILLLAALVAPAATAHTSVVTSDGQTRIVVGQLEEPVVTYQKTGLDLCFTMNNTARTPLSINPGDFEAPAGHVRLRSPSGEALALGLRGQFGRPGCYQFTQPYVLTEAGQYTLEFKGVVNGTAIDFTGVAAGGAVQDASALAFPGALDQATQDVAADVAALQARLAQVESDLAAQKAAAADEDAGRFAPGLPPVLLLAGLVGVAALVRRRA